MKDWSGFLSFTPDRVIAVTTEDELARELEAGAAVRVLGSLHSCSPICAAATVVDVNGLPKTFEWTDDGTAAVISANFTLHDTLARLAERGKALPATGGTDHQTLAGLISTGTAPATPRVSLYDGLEWLDIMTIDVATKRAVVRRVFRDDADFPGTICSLGAIGVVLRAKFSVVDEPFFAVVQKIVPMSEVLSDLDATSRRYDFWRINWMPKSDRALLWAAVRIPKEKAKIDGDYSADLSEHFLKIVFESLDIIQAGKPGPLLDRTMEVVYKVITSVYAETNVTGPLRNMLPVDRRAPLHVAMAEWSFAPEDLDQVQRTCLQYFTNHGWPNIPTEIELTPSRRHWMSPWNWPDREYVVKFNFMYLIEVCKTAAEKDRIVEHLQGLWNALVDAGIRFKAHWGKINFLTPEYVRRHYDLASFAPLVRAQFINDYLRARLQ